MNDVLLVVEMMWESDRSRTQSSLGQVGYESSRSTHVQVNKPNRISQAAGRQITCSMLLGNGAEEHCSR